MSTRPGESPEESVPVRAGQPRRPVGRDRDAAGERAAIRSGARGRRAGRRANAAGAASAGVLLVARAIRMLAGLVALVIAAGIVFVVLDANAANSIVSTVHDAAKSLAGPFDGIFKPHDPKVAIAVNWGIALLVYLVIGLLLARVVARLAIAARPRRSYD